MSLAPRTGDPAPQDLEDVRLADYLAEVIWTFDRAKFADMPKRRHGERLNMPWRLREAILWRDRGCVRCGETEWNSLSVDHIIPVSHGGPDKPENLQVLCHLCNRSKGSHYEWLG